MRKKIQFNALHTAAVVVAGMLWIASSDIRCWWCQQQPDHRPTIVSAFTTTLQQSSSWKWNRRKVCDWIRSLSATACINNVPRWIQLEHHTRSLRFVSSTSSPLGLTSTVQSALQLTTNSNNQHSEDFPPFVSTVIRFLGQGTNAVVRPGVVIVAPRYEFHHYYREAAIFIYAMGEDDDGEFVVRGVILDYPTPFTLGEMIYADNDDDDNNNNNENNNNNQKSTNALANNFLFRGGDRGGQGVILFHNQASLAQSTIGNSGVYQGGWDAALEACARGKAHPDDFKIFFNYCEFTENEIEDMFRQSEDGDAWISVEVDSSTILNSKWGKGECWAKLRNAVSQKTNEAT